MELALAQLPSNDNMKTVSVMYRNKPEYYFFDIANYHQNIMQPYIKDNNGDQACPINNKINGLFFGLGNSLPATSPFGSHRFIIDVDRLLLPTSKLYFADFYCSTKNHYVTLVVCTDGTDADMYCHGQLPQLDLTQNRFYKC